jgi:hypothetical protein
MELKKAEQIEKPNEAQHSRATFHVNLLFS